MDRRAPNTARDRWPRRRSRAPTARNQNQARPKHARPEKEYFPDANRHAPLGYQVGRSQDHPLARMRADTSLKVVDTSQSRAIARRMVGGPVSPRALGATPPPRSSCRENKMPSHFRATAFSKPHGAMSPTRGRPRAPDWAGVANAPQEGIKIIHRCRPRELEMWIDPAPLAQARSAIRSCPPTSSHGGQTERAQCRPYARACASTQMFRARIPRATLNLFDCHRTWARTPSQDPHPNAAEFRSPDPAKKFPQAPHSAFAACSLIRSIAVFISTTRLLIS